MFWWIAGGVALWLAAKYKPVVQIGAASVRIRPMTLDGSIYDEIVVNDDYRLRTTALPPNPVIIDIGAQIGIFTTFAAAIYPTARIFSYEMDDLNYSALLENTDAIKDRDSVFRAMVVGKNVPSGYTRSWFFRRASCWRRPSDAPTHHVRGDSLVQQPSARRPAEDRYRGGRV